MYLEDPNPSVSIHGRQLNTSLFVSANFGALKLSSDNDRPMPRGRDFILKLLSDIDRLMTPGSESTAFVSCLDLDEVRDVRALQLLCHVARR